MQGVECYEHISHHDDLTGFVQEHASLINKLAWHIKGRLPQHIELDDLIQSGLIGLLEAKKSFSEKEGASFTTYASLKIRCAIYEFVRKNSGITRDISQNIKKISAAVSRLENRQDTTISNKEIADEMGVSQKKYADITSEITAYKLVSTYEVASIDNIACDNYVNPLFLIEADNEKSLIQSMVQDLPKRDQLILALYYNEQLNFKKIAEIIGLTEARISQIHSTVLSKLKRKIIYQEESTL